MDTTKTYIKMCEKAEEIQRLFCSQLPAGTFWSRESNRYYSEGVTGYGYERLPEWIILPRQDQLQEMVKQETETYKALITKLLNVGYPTPIDWSLEQLWLAFVMKEKFGKVWSETDWIKQEVAVVN